MTFRVSSPILGVAANLSEVEAVAQFPLGTIIQATSPTWGEGEFIYLRGIGSTVAGSIVNYDDSFLTALDTTGLATPRPVAIAMGACVADRYGWYQIAGNASAVKANTTSFAKGAALAAGSGLAIAVASGLIINGALVAVVASAKSNVTSVRVMVNRPHNPSDVS
jgi:hypothetical protein